MKVLFYLRADYKQKRGGDLVQAEETAKALQRAGVEVDFSSDSTLDLSAYDLVHCFNSPRFAETLSFFENAHSQHKPVAFSTIFWGREELAIGLATTPKVRLARTVLGVQNASRLWRLLKGAGARQSDSAHAIERRLFEQADMLLPNSDGEAAEIKRAYKLTKLRYRPVVNAINGENFKKPPSPERQDYILSVGRIENRKNLLKLIEAAHRVGKPLTLIGGYDKGDDYALKCLSLVKKYGFTHIEHVAPAKLLPYYYAAKVHALASWYETPGLASMEAACGGCVIVSTDRGSTREYFKKEAIYCDPFKRTSIEQALRLGFAAQANEKLRQRILTDYTWEHAAAQTIAAYRELL